MYTYMITKTRPVYEYPSLINWTYNTSMFLVLSSLPFCLLSFRFSSLWAMAISSLLIPRYLVFDSFWTGTPMPVALEGAGFSKAAILLRVENKVLVMTMEQYLGDKVSGSVVVHHCHCTFNTLYWLINCPEECGGGRRRGRGLNDFSYHWLLEPWCFLYTFQD